MKLLLVDDDTLLADLLARTLRAHPDIPEVVCAESAQRAAHLLREGRFQTMILDIQLPDANGFDFAIEAIKINPALKIIGFSGHCTDDTAYRLDQSPMHAFLAQAGVMADDINTALAAIKARRRYFSASVRLQLVHFKFAADDFNKLLSPKEVFILRMVGIGWRDDPVGASLRISSETVKWHRKQIMRKLNLHDKSQLEVYAGEKGLAHFGCVRETTEASH